MLQHAASRGAKYFRGRKPQQLVYLENDHSRSSASKREAAIKKLKRPEKQALIASAMNEFDDIAVTEQQPPACV